MAALKNQLRSRHAVELHLEADLVLMQAVICMQKACSGMYLCNTEPRLWTEDAPGPVISSQACSPSLQVLIV